MTLRIGLLGASRIAPTAVIAPARDRGDVQVTAVAARDRDRARAFAAEHDIPEAAESYAALIGREDVDLVYNGLPPAAHLEWTVAALEAGKAVLCEKPFAMDSGQAELMVEAARGTGGLLIEAFHYRHHRVMHDALALVRSGAIGRVQRADAVFEAPIPRTDTELRWRRELGGGGLMDLGTYPVHALRTLLGAEPVVRSAEGTFEDGVDVTLSAVLDFDGVEGRIQTALVAPQRRAELTLVGDAGRLKIVNFIAPQYGCRFTLERDGEVEERPTDGPTTYQAQLDHVLAVIGGMTQPLLGLDDPVAQMRAIDAIYAAAGRPPA
jgi:predicted dehydrogenase